MSIQPETHLTGAGDLQTAGRTIRWAWLYDLGARLIGLGQDSAFRRESVARAGVKPGDRVLEVGCGTGDLALTAARAAGPAGQVVGIDAAAEMIQVAAGKAARQEARRASRAAAPVTFRPGLIERLAFPDASFDVVLSSLMMHHLDDDLKRRGLLEVRRVLRPGGRVCIVDFKSGASPNHFMAFLGHGRHGGAMSRDQDLPGRLQAAGFVQVTRGDMPQAAFECVCGEKPQRDDSAGASMI